MATSHSVLQGYLQKLQLKQAHEHAQLQHDEAVKQLEEAAKYHQSTIDIQRAEQEHQKAQLEFQKAVTAQQLKNTFMEHVASGLEQPQNAVPQMQQGPPQFQQQQVVAPDNLPQTQTRLNPTIQQTGVTSEIGPEDLGGFGKYLSARDRTISVSTPQARAETQRQIEEAGIPTKAREAGAVTSASAEAQVKAQTPLKMVEIAGQAAIKQMEAQQALERTKITAAGRINAASIGAAARKYAADQGLKGKSTIDADELANAIEPATLGLGDLPRSGPMAIHSKAALNKSGKVPFEKKDGDRLNSITDLSGVFEDMRNLVPLLAEGKLGALGQKAITKSPFATDLKTGINAVRGRAPQVVRNLMGIDKGRITQQEINKALDTMVEGGMRQKDAIANIERLQRDALSKVYDDILGSVPTDQKIAILQRHPKVLDELKKGTVKVDGKLVPIVMQLKDGKLGLLDTVTKTYDPIE